MVDDKGCKYMSASNVGFRRISDWTRRMSEWPRPDSDWPEIHLGESEFDLGRSEIGRIQHWTPTYTLISLTCFFLCYII